MQLSQLRQALVCYLTEQGIHAVSAWSSDRRPEHIRPVVAVSLHSLECVTGSSRYLGQQTDAQTGEVSEVYGQQLQLSYSLRLYSPKDQSDGCLALFDQIAQALALGSPDALALESITCGELSYDRDSDLLTCTALLQGSTWMCTVLNEDGVLIQDFIVKGTMV